MSLSKQQERYKTLGRRREALERWENECLYFSGGVGVLLVVGGLASDMFKAIPSWISVVFVTSAIMAGWMFGRTKVAFSWKRAVLKEWQEEPSQVGWGVRRGVRPRDDTSEIPSTGDLGYPVVDKVCFNIGILLLGVMGLSLVLTVWWWALAPSSSPDCVVNAKDNVLWVVCPEK